MFAALPEDDNLHVVSMFGSVAERTVQNMCVCLYLVCLSIYNSTVVAVPEIANMCCAGKYDYAWFGDVMLGFCCRAFLKEKCRAGEAGA